MTIEQTAWLAGWLEGEGSFSLENGGVIIHACSTDLDVIQRVADLCGVTKLTLHKKQQEHHKQAYKFRLGGQRCADVLIAIRPFMGNRRGEKIDTLLAYRASGPQRRSEASKRRWANPEFKARTSQAISASKPKGDPRWSAALHKAWKTRRDPD